MFRKASHLREGAIKFFVLQVIVCDFVYTFPRNEIYLIFHACLSISAKRKYKFLIYMISYLFQSLFCLCLIEFFNKEINELLRHVRYFPRPVIGRCVARSLSALAIDLNTYESEFVVIARFNPC